VKNGPISTNICECEMLRGGGKKVGYGWRKIL